MASLSPIPPPQSLYKKFQVSQLSPTSQPHFLSIPSRNTKLVNSTAMVLGLKLSVAQTASTPLKISTLPMASSTDVASATDTSMEPQRKKDQQPKGFVDEMRAVAMKLHTKDQAREGEKPAKGPEEKSPSSWNPTVDGYLKFLVDSKLVYETLESIVEKASVSYYAEFRNTGLERSEKLSKDLEWFKEQGHEIPEPSEPGQTYATYLEELAEKDPQGFICHFYNVYFAHSAGGRMIGRKVGEAILNKKDLEFYKWDGELPKLLQNVRDKLNKVAESWSREEKNHCLEETEKSFKYSGDLLRLILQSD